MVDVRSAFADRSRDVSEVELDGTTATRFEVDDNRPVTCAQHIARVRLAVQELLVAGAVADHPTEASQPLAQQFPVVRVNTASIVSTPSLRKILVDLQPQCQHAALVYLNESPSRPVEIDHNEDDQNDECRH